MTSDKSKLTLGGPEFPSDLDPGEAELLIAFDQWIHQHRANPERKGCPGKERLTALVLANTKFEDQYTLDHIGECAACLDDLRAIKRELSGNVCS